MNESSNDPQLIVGRSLEQVDDEKWDLLEDRVSYLSVGGPRRDNFVYLAAAMREILGEEVAERVSPAVALGLLDPRVSLEGYGLDAETHSRIARLRRRYRPVLEEAFLSIVRGPDGIRDLELTAFTIHRAGHDHEFVAVDIRRVDNAELRFELTNFGFVGAFLELIDEVIALPPGHFGATFKEAAQEIEEHLDRLRAWIDDARS